MGTDRRTPMIAGSGQLTIRGAAGDDLSPPGMLAAASLSAAESSGAGRALLQRADTISVVESISWPVPDPGRILASELLLSPRETVLSIRSGTSPIALLTDACSRISDGTSEVVLIAGVECVAALGQALKEGRDPGWPTQDEGVEPDRVVGVDREASHPLELEAGLSAPLVYYPLFESALRGTAGRNPDEQLDYLGRLWARFAEVAASNPHAWAQRFPDAAEVATAGPSNRRVSIPYPKLMNSNIGVNQAAALIVCSAEAADAVGVAADRRTFVRVTAAANDHWFASERERLDRSPALRLCAARALDHAGLEIDEIAHLDLYSCFPSAVQVGALELGIDPLDPARAPTVTGGLTFAGGPGSNYVTHSLAALCSRLRERGGHALATGIGWYLSKHAVAILSAEPPDHPFAHLDPQAEVDALPGREILPVPDSGEAMVEAYTAICDRDGEPSTGIATFLTDGGERTVAKSDDPETLATLAEGEALGAVASFTGEGRFRLSG